jgi:hypothetical protein
VGVPKFINDTTVHWTFVYCYTNVGVFVLSLRWFPGRNL